MDEDRRAKVILFSDLMSEGAGREVFRRFFEAVLERPIERPTAGPVRRGSRLLSNGDALGGFNEDESRQ